MMRPRLRSTTSIAPQQGQVSFPFALQIGHGNPERYTDRQQDVAHRGHGRGRSGSSPTTFIAAAASTGGPVPSASPPCSPSINADIIALQEVVGASPLKPGQAAEIGAALGMGWVMAPTRHLRNALFGNVVLSRFPVKHHQQHDLSWKTCEPRLAQRVDLQIGEDDILHFYNVHLGTALLERRDQAQRLASIVHDRRVSGPKIVLGDFNEWARGLATDVLAEKLHSIDLREAPEAPTHLPRVLPAPPSRSHLLRGRPRRGRQGLAAQGSPREMASDHLPLVADLAFASERRRSRPRAGLKSCHTGGRRFLGTSLAVDTSIPK